MKKMKYAISTFALGAAILLSSCGGNIQQGESSGGEGAKGEMRTELTESEMENGHASYQMDENLYVDADVTVKSKYENGVASYFLKTVYETEDTDKEKFKKNPTICQKSFEEWEALLEKIVPGKFKKDRFVINDEDDLQIAKYEGEDNQKYTLNVGWAGIVKGLDKKIPFNTPAAHLEREDGWPEVWGVWENIIQYVRNCDSGNDLDFLQDKEKQEYAEKIKTFLEEMSGRTVCSRYKFVPVGKTNINALREKSSLYATENIKEGYAAFYFDYEVDGLPFKNMYLNYTLDNDKEADDFSYWSSESGGGKELTAISEHQQEALVDKDGIIFIHCSKMRDVAEQCREASPVVTPNEVLEQVKAHYDRELLTEPCYISDIELVYTGYFSDGSDGLVRPVAAPFWVVTVYDDARFSGSACFTYNAYTGECIEEAVDLTW